MSINLTGAQLGSVNLADLHDTSIVSPATGDYLRYNSAVSGWQNSSIDTDVFNFLSTAFTSASGMVITVLPGTQKIEFSGAGTGSVTSVNVVGNETGVSVFSSAPEGGPVTSGGVFTVSLDNTAVIPGEYASANITVDSTGRITAANSGTAGATITPTNWTKTSVPYHGATGLTTVATPQELAPTLADNSAAFRNPGAPGPDYEITLPWSVTFMGLSYTSVFINCAGVLTFGAPSGSTVDGLSPVKIIAPSICYRADSSNSMRDYYYGQDGTTFYIGYNGYSSNSIATTEFPDISWEVQFSSDTPTVATLAVNTDGYTVTQNAYSTSVSAISKDLRWVDFIPWLPTVDEQAYSPIYNAVQISGDVPQNPVNIQVTGPGVTTRMLAGGIADIHVDPFNYSGINARQDVTEKVAILSSVYDMKISTDIVGAGIDIRPRGSLRLFPESYHSNNPCHIEITGCDGTSAIVGGDVHIYSGLDAGAGAGGIYLNDLKWPNLGTAPASGQVLSSGAGDGILTWAPLISNSSVSVVDNTIPRFSGTTGIVLQSSGITVDDDNALYGNKSKINFQTGATYTLLPADTGTVIDHSSAVAVTTTLPNSLPTGFVITYIQTGAGQVTFSVESGATLNNISSHNSISGQWGVVTLYVRDNTDAASAEYVLVGNTVTV